MDKIFATCNDEIQDLKGEDINDGIRNICSLPQTILEHILSLLPMKDAVRTSVLSKQWEFLWTSIPSLKFIEDFYSSRELFKNSIERMLLLHDQCSIKEFWLQCHIMGSASRVNTWITSVVRHNVQNCYIRLTKIPKSFSLPRCLFTCDTLVDLVVDLDINMRCSLRLPSQIYLPNLKSLLLANVKLIDECSIQQLLSSRALEKLYIINCSWVHLVAISISSSELKRLIIQKADIGKNNQETSVYFCEIMICDCNLEYFELSGLMSNEYSVSNLSAVDVVLSIVSDNKVPNQDVHRLKKTLREIHAIKTLCFRNMNLFKHEDAPDLTLEQLNFPVFNALHTLELVHFDTESEELGEILQRAPHLHTLQILQEIMYPSGGEDYKIFNPVPPCFFSSLKKIKIGKSYLSEGELRVLKTILQFALVLEELVISPDRMLKDDGKLETFCRTLEGYPHGSEKCKIIVEIL